ncbi:GPI-anchored surface protein, putative [Bodo saltans]|uniref:GPI-anchored surface protein, putative n=1 Tax=Bodo saltans TaxID=75058 RepID=A0A0S4J987_BODSA|nr:GPI-anchored surface protein, putative [Bodo saltans]|eukprot:CUG87936.1 GPI-anchored surface protein, putative [Bodo saltans]
MKKEEQTSQKRMKLTFVVVTGRFLLLCCCCYCFFDDASLSCPHQVRLSNPLEALSVTSRSPFSCLSFLCMFRPSTTLPTPSRASHSSGNVRRSYLKAANIKFFFLRLALK